MDFSKLKNIFSDRLKAAHAVTFIILGIFAYLLLVRIDLGDFYKIERSLGEINKNLNILKALAVYKEYINEFNSRFALGGKGAEWLMETVSESAKKKSVLLDLVKPLEGGSLFGYRKISVLVEGEAPYHDMAHFISDLEKSEKYIFIEKFELRSRKKKETSFTAERNAAFSLVVSAFEVE